METKLCRICGHLGTTHQDIFKIEGLKHKIETCLPIFVTQHCLLPDTICQDCLENISRFYHFIKNCLQSIIILESQYDVTESCLKSKRKHDKGCSVDFAVPKKAKVSQTEDQFDILFTKYQSSHAQHLKLPLEECDINLVDYEVESEISETENNQHNQDVVIVKNKNMRNLDETLDNFLTTKTIFAKQYFDNAENQLINEIKERKSVKRKCETIENLPSKIFKFGSSNRRKTLIPRKIEDQFHKVKEEIVENLEDSQDMQRFHENLEDVAIEQNRNIPEWCSPQLCLLCEEKCGGPAALAAHVFEIHGLDFNLGSENCLEKRKKIPNLLKISDIKRSNSFDENQQIDPQSPQLQSNVVNSQEQMYSDYSCQICQLFTSTKQELYAHCQTRHPSELPLMCGICFQPTTTLLNLKNHLKICAIEYPVSTRYFCSICKYGEDGMRGMENHVLVHDFLLDMCKKEVRMFDPADYVELNSSCEHGPVSPSSKSLTCNLCFQSNFQSFKDFSYHRRKQHSKFHCDLCNKFYGRNSHLWKHVNRLHKNHPSITCQICYKTSASKYHLSQHFSKIHSVKQKSRTNSTENVINANVINADLRNEQFVFRKFKNFDFPTVDDTLKRKKKSTSSEYEDISNNGTTDQEISDEVFISNENVTLPKEVDTSSDLYTNIITNYTPPPNSGDYKCPKCSKGFPKKIILKKHKKNCRPKLQKDLLTRCKSCARIFKDRQSLAKHLVNYHSEYTCEICLQKSQSKCEIVAHIRFTHPESILFCKICGNILRSTQNLSDHLQDHSNSYICQFCGDSLPSKIKLKMHILSLHRKILSLSCGICLKLFENQHILRNHVQIVHKNDLRPFTSCTVCGKNYGSKWKTYDHLNKSHGRIFKVCKTCLEIFDTEEELNSHCEEVHDSKNQNIQVKNIPCSNYLKQENEDVEESESDKDLDCIEDNDNATEEMFNNFTTEMSGMCKMSLLEKRLLGKNVINESDNRMAEEKSKIKIKISAKKQIDSSKFEEDITAQQGSSKRTVYVNSDVPSLCEICFKTWPAKKHLWQHYIRCHKSVAATVCGICLKTNVDYRALQHHLRSNHPNLLYGQGFGSNFICRICGRYHNASSKLRLHMAIHENFDWSILENKIDEVKPVITNVTDSSRRNEQNDNYFESLIEQVECSSNEGDSEDEQKNDENKNDNENSTSSEMVDDESDSDSESVESEAQNGEVHSNSGSENSQEEVEHFGTNEKSVKNRILSGNSEEVNEFQSSDSERSSSDSCTSDDDGIIDEQEDNTVSSSEPLLINGLTNSNSNPTLDNGLTDTLPFADNGLFRFKTEELDSAVKSISLECEEVVKDDLVIEYCELPITATLNEREIESAVGSIL